MQSVFTQKPKTGKTLSDSSGRANQKKQKPFAENATKSGMPVFLQSKSTDSALLDNQSEQEAVESSVNIQPKLKIGAADDPYEREADAVADKVMRMPESKVQRQAESEEEEEEQIQTKSITPLVQRQPEPEEEEEEAVPEREEDSTPILESVPTGDADELVEEDLLQAKATPGHTHQVTPGVAANIQSLKGGGQPLPPNQRHFFESRMGQDFSGVRIHTDSKAADTAQTIQAKAFTLGNNIVFNTGQYSPDNQEGKKLLAHELTHVVQQIQGRVKPTVQAKGAQMATAGSSSLQREADQVVQRVLQRQTEPEAEDSDIERARDAFYKAQDLFVEEEYSEAAENFKKAHALSPKPDFLFNIGASYEKAENYPEAIKYYDLYVKAEPGEVEKENALRRIKALWKARVDVATDSRINAVDKARIFFDYARSLWDSGKYVEAAESYKKAYEARPFAQFLFNIGASYEKAENYPEAIKYYDLYVKAEPDEVEKENALRRTKALKSVLAKAKAELDKQPYIPGEMSKLYHKLPPEMRKEFAQEVQSKFESETGVIRTLQWENPADRPMIRRWLRIRDQVLKGAVARRAATKITAAGPWH